MEASCQRIWMLLPKHPLERLQSITRVVFHIAILMVRLPMIQVTTH
jgi:hypothetical protein